jgi:hypothetical protein
MPVTLNYINRVLYRFLVVVRAVITNELKKVALALFVNFIVGSVEAIMDHAIAAGRVRYLPRISVKNLLLVVNSAPKREYYGMQIIIKSNEAGEITRLSGKVCDVRDVFVGLCIWCNSTSPPFPLESVLHMPANRTSDQDSHCRHSLRRSAPTQPQGF